MQGGNLWFTSNSWNVKTKTAFSHMLAIICWKHAVFLAKKKTRAKVVEIFINTCLSWLHGFLHICSTTAFMKHIVIPASHFLAALITRSLWLSPCYKWRQDASLKCCLLDLKCDARCHLSFLLGGKEAGWGVSLPPLPRAAFTAFSLPGSSCCLYSQDLCLPSSACL